MAIYTLTNEFISTNAKCPPDKKKAEFCDSVVPGLLVECRSAQGSVPSWYWRRKVDGKTTYKHLGTIRELSLEDARKQVLALKSQTGPAPVIPASSTPGSDGDVMTLDQFWNSHYHPHAKVHKRSFKRDAQLYLLRIRAKFGHLPLQKITRLAVQQFQSALVAEGLKPATANQHIQLMRRLCNLAVSWEMLDRNVLKGIPLLHLDNQVEHYLDDDQVKRLVEVLRNHENRNVSLIVLFLLSTGARLREGLDAQWKQVDVTNGVWKIPASNSKSKKLKHLPLNKSALWVIEQLDSKEKSPYLFPSPFKGKPYTTITRQWWTIRKAAGIPDNVRIHDLRHTYASRLVSSGQSLYVVQKLLGHADPRTTMRYAHLNMATMQEASNRAAFAVS